MKKVLTGPAVLMLLGIYISVFGQPHIPYGARMNSGKIHYNDGRYKKAAEQFVFAVEENPNSAEARIWLAMSYSHIQRYPEASAQFDTAFAKDSVYYNKMEKNEDFKFQAWTSFLAMSRDYLVSNDTNDWKTALHYVKQSLRLEPKSRQALTMLAQLYVQLNRLDDLKQQAMAIVKIDTENPLGYNMLALYFFNRSEWDSAHYFYLEAAKRHQLTEKKSKEMLSSQLAIKDTMRLNQVAASLVQARKDTNLNRLTGYIEDSLKAKPKLRVIARIADDLYLTRNELNTSYFRAGIASLQKGNAEKDTAAQMRYFNQAVAEFEQAIFYNNLDLDAKHNLAFTFYRMGDPSSNLRAMTLYEEILKASVLPLTELSTELGDSLMGLISGNIIPKGFTQIPSELGIKVENELAKRGSETTNPQWLYFLNLSRIKNPVPPFDKKEVFFSFLTAKALENLYLFFGSTQANVATDLKREGKKDEANKRYDDAIVSFNLVLALNPKSSDALTSLIVCYREKDEKEKAVETIKRLEELKKGE